MASKSEVARLLNQIETEYLAAQRGLTGYAESAKHRSITASMENFEKLHEDLRDIVGEDAMKLVAERLNTLPEQSGAIHEQGGACHVSIQGISEYRSCLW